MVELGPKQRGRWMAKVSLRGDLRLCTRPAKNSFAFGNHPPTRGQSRVTMGVHLTSNPLETPLSFLSVRALPAVLAVMLVTACATASTATSVPGQDAPAAQAERVTRSEGAAESTGAEKDARTAAQQKIDSRL